MFQPNIAAIFNNIKYQRFLQHLIADHYLILRDNVRSRLNFSDGKVYSIQLTLWSQNIFEHSCSPNVVMASDAGFSFGIAVRPIKKGEPLLRDLYDSMFIFSYTKRRDHLMEKYKIGCKCKQCVTCADIESLPALTLDPDFQYISNHSKFTLPNAFAVNVTSNAKTIREKSEAFLVKYGRGAWCQELARIIQLFAALYDSMTMTNKMLYEMPNFNGNGSEEEQGHES